MNRIQDEVYEELREFCSANNISERQFCVMVFNDHKVLNRLKEETVYASTLDKIRSFISSYDTNH